MNSPQDHGNTDQASHRPPPGTHHNVIEVAVVTTSGRWPSKGFEHLEAQEPVQVALTKAVHELHIVGAEGWLATANGRELDPRHSFAQQGLTGEVTLQYGPRAGGGGGHA
jgi:hypothetical protein